MRARRFIFQPRIVVTRTIIAFASNNNNNDTMTDNNTNMLFTHRHHDALLPIPIHWTQTRHFCRRSAIVFNNQDSKDNNNNNHNNIQGLTEA